MSLILCKMRRPMSGMGLVSTLSPSHLPMTEMGPSNAAASAEGLNRRKYVKLGNSYIFALYGVEALGPLARSILRNL